MTDLSQQPHDTSFPPQKRTPWRIAAFALVLGIVISAVMFVQLRSAQQNRLQEMFSRESQGRAADLERAVTALLQEVEDLAALYECSEKVEPQEFALFAQHLLDRNRCFLALAWAPQVRSGSQTQSQPFSSAPASATAPSPISGRRYPITYLLPHAATLRPGEDLYSRPQLRLAMDYADAVASSVLATYDPRTESVLAVAPIYFQGHKSIGPTGQREGLTGFAVAQIHMPILIHRAFATEPHARVETILTDRMAAGAPQQLGRFYPRAAHPSPPSGLVDERFIDVGGRQWGVRSQASQGYVQDRLPNTPWAVLGLGLVASLSVSYYLLSTLGRSQDVQRLVSQQTAQLRETNLLMEAEILSRRKAESLLQLQRNLAAALGGVQSVEDVLTTALQAALQIGGLDCGGIYLLDPVRCTADLPIHRGLSDDFVRAVGHLEPSDARVQMLVGGRTLVVEDVPKHRPADDPMQKEGLFSIIAAPLWHQDQVIGSLNLGSHRHDGISPQTCSAVEAIASQIGSALARARVSQALRESEERLRVVAENVDAIFYRLSPDGRVVYVSPQVARYGYDAQELLGQDYQQFIYPPDRPMVLSRFAAVLSNGRPTFAEYRMFTKDGAVRWMQDSTVSACDANGRVVAVTGILQDVTHRKEAEQRIRDSERRYRSLFENSPTCLWEEDFSAVREHLDSLQASGVEDLSGYLRENPQAIRHCASLVRIVDVNAATLGLFDAPSKEALLGNLDKVFTEDSYPVFAEELIHLVQGTRSFHTDATNRTLGGKTKDIVLHVALVPGFEKTWAHAMVSMIDITDRKAAEEALRVSEEKYRILVESAGETIATVDRDGRFLFVNNTGAERLEMTVNQVIGKTMWDIFPQSVAERQMQSIRRVIDTRQPLTMETMTAVRGQMRWYSTSIVPVLDAQGGAASALIIARDIHDRMQAQKALQAARRKLMNAREAERRRIAVELHDSINQSLVALQLTLHNTLNSAGASLGAAPLHALSAAAQQCTALVREVRNLCHGLYPPTLQSLGLGSGLRELARQCTAAGMAASVLDTSQTKWLRFDPDVEIALFRAAQEAANNALRHSGAKHLLLALEHEGGTTTLSVTDDGKGFDPQNVASGLGLISLRENAEAIDGTLSIASRPGQTRVSVAVPAKPLETPDRNRR